MRKQFPVVAPLGRLYEPLLQLTERVHRALAVTEKIVWTDNNGYVFATPTDLLPTISPYATIGVYARWTSLPMIEMGLRRALRERASAWIVDWKAAYSLSARSTDHHSMPVAPPRKRKRRKAANAEAQAIPLNAGRSSHLQAQP